MKLPFLDAGANHFVIRSFVRVYTRCTINYVRYFLRVLTCSLIDPS